MKVDVDIVIKDFEWKALKNKLHEMQTTHGEAGFYSDPHPNGRGATMAEVATYNEYGTKDIPARPFFAPAARQSRVVMSRMFVQRFQQILLNRTTVSKSLKELSDRQAEWIKERILFNTYARTIPNADFTISKKGFNRPLFETGYMADNVKTKVVKE